MATVTRQVRRERAREIRRLERRVHALTARAIEMVARGAPRAERERLEAERAEAARAFDALVAEALPPGLAEAIEAEARAEPDVRGLAAAIAAPHLGVSEGEALELFDMALAVERCNAGGRGHG